VQHGADVVLLHLAALRRVAQRTLEALNDPDIKPDGWYAVLAGLNLLAANVPENAIALLKSQQPLPTAADRTAG
jgi:hypothetical protein